MGIVDTYAHTYIYICVVRYNTFSLCETVDIHIYTSPTGSINTSARNISRCVIVKETNLNKVVGSEN